AQQQLANEKLKLDLRPLVLKLRLSCSYRVASLAIHLIETRPSIYPIKDQPPFLTSATCEHQPGKPKSFGSGDALQATRGDDYTVLLNLYQFHLERGYQIIQKDPPETFHILNFKDYLA
ncbi:hypothetical protein H100_02972, partial [Trichophyton rubrum MR850]